MIFKLNLLNFILPMLIAILLIIPILILLCTSVISKKKYFSREKMSSFECGFDPKSFLHQPFSLRFFFILLMFLIFDSEIIIMLPMVSSLHEMSLHILITIIMAFMIILLLGILLELHLGTLNWS